VEATQPATVRCDSCGRDEPPADVVTVHRVYVTPPERGFEDLTEPRIQVVEALERWCFPCRSSYPHQVEGEDEPNL
jgi:hypothetical protein